MSSGNQQPFMDSKAFDKANSTYVLFPSQADAILASLQLFHDVPCRIMDLIFTVVAHPDFDAKQLILRNSADVIDVVEENRLKDRMSVVHKRSLNSNGYMEQAGFPQFVLDEIVDIIHSERMDTISTHFDKPLDIDMSVEYDSVGSDTLKAISCVHRSWTTPAQKALGRVLHICRPTDRMWVLLEPVKKSIFGPWTSVVAMQFFPSTESDEYGYRDFTDDFQKDYHQWFETLHRILVSFTNLKTVLIRSCASFFCEWSNFTIRELVRRNIYLEEVTICGEFILDPLVESIRISEYLRTLDIQGVRLSDESRKRAIQGPGFARLSNLTIRRSFPTLEEDFMMILILFNRSIPCLKSLRIVDYTEWYEPFEKYAARALTPTQCATIFRPLCALHIDSRAAADKWLKWISPYCSCLDSLTIIDDIGRGSSLEKDQAYLPDSSAIFEHLCTVRIGSREAAASWVERIVPYCHCLKTFTLETSVSLSPNMLSLVPASIQNLNLRLIISDLRDDVKSISSWLKYILKTSFFWDLKSFTLFLSRDASDCLRRYDHFVEERKIRTKVQTFEEQMSVACELEGAEFKCYLDISDR